MSEVNAVDVTKGMQELLSRLPKTDTFPLHSRINPEYQKEHIALSLTPGNVLLALHRAREAQELAVSYRGFKVGAAIVGMTLGRSRFQIMTGVNVKPDEESNMNVHAEQVALQKLHDRHFDAASIIAVVGETQDDKQSGNAMPTLHPCGLCRGVMSSDPAVDPEATLVVSALPDFSKIELYNLESLHAFHTDGDASGMKTFSFPHLSIFDPLSQQEQSQQEIVLEDSPELIKEERLWDGTIGQYVTSKRMDILLNL